MLLDDLGVQVGALRELAAQGKLTTEVVVQGLLEQSSVIEDEYSRTIATFAQQTEVATNNLTKFIGESTTVQHTVAAAGDALVTVSDNLEAISDAVIVLASVFGARLAPSILAAVVQFKAYIVESTRATVTTNAFGQVVGRTTVAANAATLAVNGLRAAMALLGGPVGIAIIAATALIAFGDSADDADTSASGLTKTVSQLATEFKALSAAELAQSVTQTESEIADLKQTLGELRQAQKETAEEQQRLGQPINTSAATESILELEGELQAAENRAKALQVALGNVGGGEGPTLDTGTAGDAQIANEQRVTQSLQDELAFRRRF